MVIPSSGRIYKAIQFRFNSSPDVECEWDFDDGSISYEQNPRHAYYKKGSYTVKLIVQDKLKCERKIFIHEIERCKPPILNAKFAQLVRNIVNEPNKSRQDFLEQQLYDKLESWSPSKGVNVPVKRYGVTDRFQTFYKNYKSEINYFRFELKWNADCKLERIEVY